MCASSAIFTSFFSNGIGGSAVATSAKQEQFVSYVALMKERPVVGLGHPLRAEAKFCRSS
jgi:hypothetical protein